MTFEEYKAMIEARQMPARIAHLERMARRYADASLSDRVELRKWWSDRYCDILDEITRQHQGKATPELVRRAKKAWDDRYTYFMPRVHATA